MTRTHLKRYASPVCLGISWIPCIAVSGAGWPVVASRRIAAWCRRRVKQCRQEGEQCLAHGMHMWAGHRVCGQTRRVPQTLALAARTCGRKNAVRVSVAGACRGETWKAVGGRRPAGGAAARWRAPVHTQSPLRARSRVDGEKSEYRND